MMCSLNKNLVVCSEDEGKRLDKFLAEKLNFLSRTKIHGLISEEKVWVDGKLKKPSFPLQNAQKISIIIEEEKNELKPFDFKINIIHEDNDIIVVDKPTGLVVHPPQQNYCKTLVNALLYSKKQLSRMDTLRPGVVHRLDKETSGVMVLAKNERSHNNLINQFKERKVKKEYCAIVLGRLIRNKLTVDLPLARDKKNRLKMKISLVNSKKAHTEVEVINRFNGSTFLSIKPITGRMHQIRVHLKFLGFPVVGDKKYGIKDGFKELFLHAKKLSFHHPKKGNFLTFKSPLPKRFNDFIYKQIKNVQNKTFKPN